MQKDNSEEKFRIDKWLFAARFFKTRSLAAEAIERGRVTINEQRVKPAKLLTEGELLAIRIGNYQYVIEVLGLSNKRGSATMAQKLYRETEESRKQREIVAERLKAQPQPFYTKGR
nr:RNA-binding S4 domain-containing protein [Betaproteobacteria bacterium]